MIENTNNNKHDSTLINNSILNSSSEILKSVDLNKKSKKDIKNLSNITNLEDIFLNRTSLTHG